MSCGHGHPLTETPAPAALPWPAVDGADNALSHPDELAAYLAAVRALPGFDHLIIPVGKGLSVAYRAGRDEAPPA